MQAVNRFLYGPTPQEKVRKWRQDLKAEQRKLDRTIRQIDSAQATTRGQLKQLANKGDVKNAKILAREVVRSNKQKDKMYTSKAMLNSIDMQLTHQLATLKITGTLQKSTEIMKLSNSVMKLPELQATMKNMSQEMMKAGIMSEMVDDVMESLDIDEEIEEEADEEVDKVLFEITDGKLGEAGKVGGQLPQVPAEVEEEDAREVERMQAQLDGLLRS
ncbi:hypothetical protein BT69DRAFT_1345715 [Atractiella rhizophila]|nr:hypothetical protein BT69DRAFT_1345715 [Atractiella rhizophila]